MKDEGRLLFDRSDWRQNLDVAVNPLEFTVLLRGLFYLSRVVEAQGSVLEEVIVANPYARENGILRSTFQLLSIMQEMNLLDHPDYRMLAATLRRRALVMMRCGRYEDLARRFSGAIIDHETFWEEGFRQIKEIQFPDAESLTYQRRTLLHDQRELESMTAPNMFRKVLLSRAGATNESEETVIQEYRARGLRKRKIQAGIERMITAETRDWRVALQPFTKRLEVYSNDDEYLYQAILLLSKHFDNRLASDRDLSTKAKTTYRTLTALEDGQAGQEDTEYAVPLREYLRSAVKDREPLLLWLQAFRNETASFLLLRSIQDNPERFLDLEKLLIHQLSKAGLLRQKGEQDLYLRQSSSLDDAKLLGSLPTVLGQLQLLADHHPGRVLSFDMHIRSVSEAATQAGTELSSPDDNPIASLLTAESLEELTRRTAKMRVEDLVNGERARIDSAFVSVQLRLKHYRRLLAASWWKNQNFSEFMAGLRFQWEQRQLRRSQETAPTSKYVLSQIYYSSEPLSNYDDLPFVPLQYEDALLKNFLQNGDGKDISAYSEERKTQYSLDEALKFAMKVKNKGMIYAVQARNDRLPVYNGYRFHSAWKLNTGDDDWLVYAYPEESEQFGPGIQESSIGRASREVYPEHILFDFEKAKAYLETLKSNPAIYEIYRDCITALHLTNVNGKEAIRNIVIEAMQKLHAYIKANSYYDIRDNAFPDDVDALQYVAAHPEVGFKCIEAARVAKAFLDSIGVKCSILSGECPYIFNGQAVTSVATSHAICVAVFPSGTPIEIDLTPPLTMRTPDSVRRHFIKLDVPGGHAVEGDRSNLEIARHQVFVLARAALIASVISLGVKAAVFPNTGLLELPVVTFNAQEVPTQDDSDVASSNESGKGSSDGVAPTDTRDRLNIDLSQIPWLEIGAGLLAVLGGSAGMLVAYDKVLQKKREKQWEEMRKTPIEKNFSLHEQIPVSAALHKIQFENSPKTSQLELRKVSRAIKRMDWDTARPVLEFVAITLNENELTGELLAAHLAEKRYTAAYDLLAYQAFVNKQKTTPALSLRFLTAHPQAMRALLKRGEEITPYVEGIEQVRPPLNESTADFKLFVRSMDVMQLMQEFKASLSRELELHQISMDIAAGEVDKTDQELATRARAAAWKYRRNVLMTINGIEKSLANGAVKIITQAELDQIKAALNTEKTSQTS